MPTSGSERGGRRWAGGAVVHDLAVIGAGPAGLAAVVAAADLGLRCVLLDAGARVGGQYYRHPAPELRAARPDRLHHHWHAFADRADRLTSHCRSGRVDQLTHHHVWAAEPGETWRLFAATGPDGAGGAVITARAVLLATGAYERQLPFPGWTLPGVVSAGGVQAMLKSGLVLPGRRIVVAGSGPLLLAVAASLAAAGARVPAVVEAADYLGYARRPDVLVGVPGKLAEGAAHGAAFLWHRVRLLRGGAVVEAHGDERVTAVTVARLDGDWRVVPGTARRVACDALAVGHGLVPQIELAVELGAATRVTPDGAVALRVDGRQRTSVPGLWAAGESCGVGGAELALCEGELAARAIAGEVAGRSVDPPSELLGRRRRLRAFAELMAASHRPGQGWADWLRPDTEVCRCEEVTAAAVWAAVDDLGAGDVRTVKLLTRAGMGWCQGRMCGSAVGLLAEGAGPAAGAGDGSGTAPVADRRPLSCPVRLGELAALAEGSVEE
ncbi:FAD-dependent oxidoreductase [Kitasatospora sp. NPDC052896]|uniref:FAD-dependent oxidoreductase n=1 Tax=Kitasatospora sp. NPDC052896 TaxID=3364061 RepID=UPI0037C91E28